MLKYVNVIKTFRSYGGPEEGGWYYDSEQEVIASATARSEAEVEETVKLFTKLHKLGWNSRDCASVKITVTDELPVDQIFPRPSYE